MNRQLRRLTASLLILSIVGTARAETIGHSVSADRERIAAHLNREDVAAELVNRGITKEEAKARVAALTDDEAAALAGRMDSLPAGGFVQVIAAIAMAAPAVIAILAGAVVLLVGGTVVVVSAMVKHGSNAPAASAAAPARADLPAPKPAATRVAQATQPPFPVSCRFGCGN